MSLYDSLGIDAEAARSMRRNRSAQGGGVGMRAAGNASIAAGRMQGSIHDRLAEFDMDLNFAQNNLGQAKGVGALQGGACEGRYGARKGGR